MLDLKDGNLKYWKYWELPFSENKKDLKEEDLLERLEGLLRDAVTIRLKSDVPLGAFLSGGIDSSLVVALMSQISNKPVKTFTIGFLEKKYNELTYAKIVSQHFQTEHHEMVIRPDVFEVLFFLAQQIDEPFSDSSVIPTYYVSRETRRYVKVAISGDGGDELFGGYIHYPRLVREYQLMKFIPSFIRKGLAQIGKKFPERQKLGFLKRIENDNIIQNITDIGIFNFKFHERERLFKREITEKLTGKILDPELYRMSFADSYNGDYKTKAYYADFKTSLIDDMLVKVDRASMLVSLEVRSPLLDYRMAEFAFKEIPSDMKTRGIVRIRNKYLLKKLAKRILPKELNLERKQGFSIPIGEWFS